MESTPVDDTRPAAAGAAPTTGASDLPADRDVPQPAAVTFEPVYYFFSGSLMDEDVLRSVAGLGPGQPAELRDAWIEGLDMKMWMGVYPTLLPRPGDGGGKVGGRAWLAEDPVHCDRLQRYETSACRPADVDIHLGGTVVRGRTFRWARDPGSLELSEGAFDLEHYRKYFKPHIFG